MHSKRLRPLFRITLRHRSHNTDEKMITQIINGNIHTPSGWKKGGSVLFDNGIILEVRDNSRIEPSAHVIDAQGMTVAPGGVDIHLHGGGGHDFLEVSEDAFQTVIDVHMRHGTTACLPTLASTDFAHMTRAAEVCQHLMTQPNSPILGLHLEGPYLNLNKAGGQESEFISPPNPEQYHQITEQFQCIRRWDAAPELPGALQFAKHVTSRGIVAAIAHTEADFPIIATARQAGFSHVTHFYNAMTVTHNRNAFKHEGTVESIFLFDDMTVEVIADGIHVPPALLKLIHKIKGPERTALVTDALACTDSNNSRAYDPRVIIENGVGMLADHSALAGSVATMDRLIKTMVKQAEIPLFDTLTMAALTPATIIGADNRKGSLQPGKDADIILLDSEINLRAVFAMGRAILPLS